MSDLPQSSNKIVLPAGINLPGPIWIAATVLAVSLANRFTDTWWVELIITLASILLPLVIENNADLKKALNLIDVLSKRPASGTPGTRSLEAAPVLDIPQSQMPRKANPLVGYLFGGQT